MNQTKVFPLSPNIDRSRIPTDFSMSRGAIKELAAHFGVDVPRLIRSRGKGASYVPSRKTIRLAARSFRGIDSLLHEFAHHLQDTPQYACLRPEGRALRPSWYSGAPRKARSIHGPDFFAALLAVSTFAYGSAKHYSWANEYKAIAAKYKREYGESHNIYGASDITRNPVRVPTPGSIRITLGQLLTYPLPVAAAPMHKTTPSAARRAQGNAAWAPPSEANEFRGGCLWRKFKGNK